MQSRLKWFALLLTYYPKVYNSDLSLFFSFIFIFSSKSMASSITANYLQKFVRNYFFERAWTTHILSCTVGNISGVSCLAPLFHSFLQKEHLILGKLNTALFHRMKKWWRQPLPSFHIFFQNFSWNGFSLPWR